MISKKLRDAFHATTRPITEGDGMKLNIYETNFGAVVIGEKLAALKNDKRTKQGKMKARTLRALDVLAETAYMRDCEIGDLLITRVSE